MAPVQMHYSLAVFREDWDHTFSHFPYLIPRVSSSCLHLLGAVAVSRSVMMGTERYDGKTACTRWGAAPNTI